MRRFLALFSTVTLAATGAVTRPLAAQSGEPTTGPADLIDSIDIARHVGVIADDSMMGRATPGIGLELAAEYVAGEFEKLGLKPADERIVRRPRCRPTAGCNAATIDDDSWLQRYPLVGGLVPKYDDSRLHFTTRIQRHETPIVDEEGWPLEKRVTVGFDDAARFAVDTLPESGARGNWEAIAPPPTYVIAGPQTLASLQQASLRDKLVLYLPPAGGDTAFERQAVALLERSNHVVVVNDEKPATFAARRQDAEAKPVVVVNAYMEAPLGVRHWAAYVRSDAIKPLLAAAGLDVDRTRASATPVVRHLPATRAALELGVTAADEVTAVNVLGMLEGSDPALRHQYVVFMAHLDGRGAPSRGAADNASGVAALIELAKAYSRSDAQPRRSLLFVAVAGGAKDFSGAYYFAERLPRRWGERIAMGINLDMIGRPAGDTVTVDGIQDFDFKVRPDWIAAEHGELGLTVVDGGAAASSESDHVALVRSAIPSLSFHVGTHADSLGADMRPGVDVAQSTRIARLVYYVSREIADADRQPGWTATGRRHRLLLLGQ